MVTGPCVVSRIKVFSVSAMLSSLRLVEVSGCEIWMAKGRPATAPAIASVNGIGVQRCNASMAAIRYSQTVVVVGLFQFIGDAGPAQNLADRG